MGAGAADSLLSHDVLVAVVNSARAKDLRPIRQGGLLVADECHRYGSAVNQLALDPRFGRRLGLSATYAREDNGNLAWLDPYFGGTCFRLGYERAVADGIVARFRVVLLGVQFSSSERAAYEKLTKLMGAWRGRLVSQVRCAGGAVRRLRAGGFSTGQTAMRRAHGRLGNTGGRCSNGVACWLTRRPRTPPYANWRRR